MTNANQQLKRNAQRGALYAQGRDFNPNNIGSIGGYTLYYVLGFLFQNLAHDLWGLGNNPPTTTNGVSWVYKYQSTEQFSETTFMTLNPNWNDAQYPQPDRYTNHHPW